MDDDNALIVPEAGVPHAASSHIPASTNTFAVGPEAFVHNPYGCFGGPANVWPRGFPLDAINDGDSTRCDAVAVDSSGEERQEPWLLGVVQALANHDPDVDAVYRLTYPPGGLPFDFEGGEPAPEGTSPLKIVPPAAFTPYNAQVIWIHAWMDGFGFCWICALCVVAIVRVGRESRWCPNCSAVGWFPWVACSLAYKGAGTMHGYRGVTATALFGAVLLQKLTQ